VMKSKNIRQIKSISFSIKLLIPSRMEILKNNWKKLFEKQHPLIPPIHLDICKPPHLINWRTMLQKRLTFRENNKVLLNASTMRSKMNQMIIIIPSLQENSYLKKPLVSKSQNLWMIHTIKFQPH
jgi:hypothetical protein